MSADLNLPVIQQGTFVRQIVYRPETSSTNTLAAELIASGSCQIPCLVIAKRQTAGRGRGSNRWWSSPGALTFSLVIEAQRAAEQSQICSLVAGLAICGALEKFAPAADFALKWPNDVYLHGKKICGILIERPGTMHEKMIVGIGINLNNSIRLAPTAIAQGATSMIDVSGHPFDTTIVLVEVLQQLERRFLQMRDAGTSLLDEWRLFDLLRGRSVEVNVYSEVVRGVSMGIDSDGALLVDTPVGRRRLLGGTVVGYSEQKFGP
jgi:BirA family biotin operon repressor/biotin-[acetyl-CoA-carboxylase] ligase